jgi:GNAT superfamily N-acetyltransferase
LYKDEPAYVPFLLNDEIKTFTKKTNPAYDFCETKLFLAYKDNKIVGRIAALINHAYNKKWNKNAIRFTRFDFIDDYEVSEALFNEVIKWAKERKFTEVMGPIGFTDLDHEGMLVEGFDELNMTITFYNHPYYIKHMEKLGLIKDIDWVEYQVTVPSELDVRIDRISNHLIERYGYKLVTYNNRKVLKKEAYEAFKVIDEAFSVLYGTVPLTEKIIDQTINDYISLVNMKYVCAVKDKDNKLIAFAILVPSTAKAQKACNRRMFRGIFKFLKALNGKNDVLEMFLIGILKDYQKQGVPAIIMNHIMKVCHANGIKFCETGPELETNENIQSMWKTFETRQHKRRRCWIKKIDE